MWQKRKTMKLFRSPDTYDLAKGLALGGQSSSSSLALAELSGEEFFPSWTLRPPSLGRPSFSSLPPLGERLSSSPPRLRERSRPRSHHPITPENGNSSECPWCSSWPSSPAPRGVPEPAAPSNGRPLGPLAMGPDRWFVRPSPASPVKGKGSLDPA